MLKSSERPVRDCPLHVYDSFLARQLPTPLSPLGCVRSHPQRAEPQPGQA